MTRVTRYVRAARSLPDSTRTKRSPSRCSSTTASSLNTQRVPSNGARTSAPRASRVIRCIGDRAQAAATSAWHPAQTAEPA